MREAYSVLSRFLSTAVKERAPSIAGRCEAVLKEAEAALVGDTHLKPGFNQHPDL